MLTPELKALQKDWGLERFRRADEALTQFYSEVGVPTQLHQMNRLMEYHEDAFELFSTRVLRWLKEKTEAK